MGEPCGVGKAHVQLVEGQEGEFGRNTSTCVEGLKCEYPGPSALCPAKLGVCVSVGRVDIIQYISIYA